MKPQKFNFCGFFVPILFLPDFKLRDMEKSSIIRVNEERQVSDMDILWSDRKRWTFFGLPWTFTKYTCTPEKFIVESGFLSTKEEEIRLYRIMDLTLERSFIQRLFGLGTITCDTVDKSTPKLYIKNIKEPRRVKELISEAVEEERVKKRVSSREYMASEECDCDCDHDHEED